MFNELLTQEVFNHTTIHPIGLLVVFMLACAMFMVPRPYVLVPMLILACCVAAAQRVVIASFDFNFLRILILVGWTRVILRHETTGFSWKLIDTLVAAWVLVSTTMASLLHANMNSLVYELGLMYDAVGIYFLTRIIIRDWEDLYAMARCAAIISMPVAAAFLIEAMTARNMFAIFGGVPELTEMRAGRLRCQGPFSHPILAGCFWAALMPFMASLFWVRGVHDKALAIIGLACASIVIVTCASSTPVSGVAAGVLAASLFLVRRRMSWVRWGSVAALIALQLVMHKPVWHLMSRIDIISGSTGWYRYLVLDSFLRHFPDWWLRGTLHYEQWWEWGMDDVTNQYAAHGIEGGVWSLGLFLGIIAVAFHAVGKIWRRAGRTQCVLIQRGDDRGSPQEGSHSFNVSRKARLAMAWALGVSLFIHCVAFFGVTYFGQSVLVWYLSLGFIGAMAPLHLKKLRVVEKSDEEVEAPSRDQERLHLA